MSFWSVQVIQNCNWNYDVEHNGEFVREIYVEDDLTIPEEISIIRDEVSMFLSNFPGNIVYGIIEKIKKQAK